MQYAVGGGNVMSVGGSGRVCLQFYSITTRNIRNPGVWQCLGFCTADFWSLLANESAEQKPKHCLTPGFLIPLITTINLSSSSLVEVGEKKQFTE